MVKSLSRYGAGIVESWERREDGMFELVWVVKRKKAERKKAESPAWAKAGIWGIAEGCRVVGGGGDKR